MILTFFNPWKHYYTLKIQKDFKLKIQKDSTLAIQKDSIQKCFIICFMLLILFITLKHDSRVKIQKDYTLKIQKGLRTKVFFNPFYALMFVNPWKHKKSRKALGKKTVGIRCVNWECFTRLLLFDWKNIYNQSQKISETTI